LTGLTQHIVQKGDTLWKISKQHGVPLNELIAANPQIPNPDKIDEGMTVMVPTGGMASAPNEAPVTPYPAEMPAAPAPEPAGTLEGEEPEAVNNQVPETPQPAPAPAPAPAYPSVPKWEGLWKYVVKNGDSMFKIAKQVGVTFEHLKAANPQVSDADKIYPGQVLNIPSSGMKMKGNPGLSAKEQLTSPIMNKEQLTAPIMQQQQPTAPINVQQPINKEQLTSPKEMVPVEKPITAPMYHPAPPISPIEINANLQYAPHKEQYLDYHPTQVQQIQQAPVQVQQQQHHHQEQPHHVPYMHAPMMMYLPVSMKHKKCQKHHKKCHKQHKKCGHKKLYHNVYYHDLHAHMMHLHAQQQMALGTYPKTFYRED
jgi:spore coat assembly protein SafA